MFSWEAPIGGALSITTVGPTKADLARRSLWYECGWWRADLVRGRLLPSERVWKNEGVRPASYIVHHPDRLLLFHNNAFRVEESRAYIPVVHATLFAHVDQ
jgi:hypothetical protein